MNPFSRFAPVIAVSLTLFFVLVAPSRTAAQVTVDTITGPNRLGLLLDTECLAKNSPPLTVRAQVKNTGISLATVAVTAEMGSDKGVVEALPSQTITIPAGGTVPVVWTFAAPGYGWWSVTARIDTASEGKEVAFGVLHAPHTGTRPNSIFGINTGSSPEDRAIAQTDWRKMAARYTRA